MMKIKSVFLILLLSIILFAFVVFAQTNNEKAQDDNYIIYDNCFPSVEKAMDLYGEISEIVFDKQENIKEVHTLAELIDFIDKNISYLSIENATGIINKFETSQRIFLPKLEEKYFDDKIQGKLSELYLQDFNLDKFNDIVRIEETEEVEIKELLLATVRSGYKVETAEGMFYPIINYEFYKRYTPYLTRDYCEYINLMAVESNIPPATDGALVIGWEQLINRALAQEAFLREYPEALKVAEVKNLYEKYLNFIFYGLNNTPLFEYKTKEMRDEARDIYLEMSRDKINSELIRELGLFMNLLEENNYILTEEVDNYRKEILENIFFKYEFYFQMIKDNFTAMQKNIDMLKEESNVQKVQESNYGDMYQMTEVLKVTENELLFDAVEIIFSDNHKGHFTTGKRYPYYTDAAMGGWRGITVKDNFGVWHSFSWQESINH